MGLKTPNIDRIAEEGMLFTDIYAEQSCTAGRPSFVTGQSGLRAGMTNPAACSLRALQARYACWTGTRYLQDISVNREAR